MKCIYLVISWILICSCTSEVKIPVIHHESEFCRDPNDSLILKFYQDHPEIIESYDRFYKDSINDQYAFLHAFYKEFETTYFKDSLHYIVYNGHDGWGREFLFVVINFKGVISLLPITKNYYYYENDLVGSELTKLLPKIYEENYYSKVDVAARLINKMFLSYNWIKPFEIQDTSKLRYIALEINSRLNHDGLKRNYKEPSHIKYFWKRLNSIQDSIVNFSHPPNFPTSKYIIYSDRYWAIWILGITDTKITLEFFNPTNFMHLYL